MGLAAITALLIAASPDGGVDAGLGWADPLYSDCPAAPAPDPGRRWLAVHARARLEGRLPSWRPATPAGAHSSRFAAGPAPFSSGSLTVDLALWGLGVLGGMVLGWSARGFAR
jgi:hypothetical protein